MPISALFKSAIAAMPPLLSRDVLITRNLLGAKKRLSVAERIELLELIRKLIDTQVSVAIRDDSMIESHSLLAIAREIDDHVHARLKELNPDSDCSDKWDELKRLQIERLEQLDAEPTSDGYSLAAEIAMVEKMQSHAKRTNYIKLADTHRKLIASEAINTRHRHGLVAKVDAIRIFQELLTIIEQRLGNVDEIAEASIQLVRNASIHTTNAAAVHA